MVYALRKIRSVTLIRLFTISTSELIYGLLSPDEAPKWRQSRYSVLIRENGAFGGFGTKVMKEDCTKLEVAHIVPFLFLRVTMDWHVPVADTIQFEPTCSLTEQRAEIYNWLQKIGGQ